MLNAQQTRELQKEIQENFEKRSNSLEKATINLIESVKQTNETVRELSKNVDELRAAQKETDALFKKTDERPKRGSLYGGEIFQPVQTAIPNNLEEKCLNLS